MSRCASVGAHSIATVCAMCVSEVFRVRHTLVVVSPSACQVVQHGCIMRCGNVFRVTGLFSFQHLGQSCVAVAFPVFDGRRTVKNRTC